MVSPSIPASQLVNVTPGVLGAGGSGQVLNGLILSNAQRVPVGTVVSFPTAGAVGAYFGNTSPEYLAAQSYFNGFLNSVVKPASLLFFQYSDNGKTSAYLRGASIASLGLTGIQAITPGTLTITVDGVTATSSSINLSSATSYSNAASIIQTALNLSDAKFTASMSTTTMTVSAVATGTLAVGQYITGSGVAANTRISALGSGTGGAGTYTISQSQTVSSTAMQAGLASVTYDSIGGGFQISSTWPGSPNSTVTFASGTIATALNLTQATGAILSQGNNADNPANAMATVLTQTGNWGNFMTINLPSVADATTFAQWANTSNGAYGYVCWTTDATLIAPNPTASIAYAVQQAGYSGTRVIYSPVNQYLTAAFVMSIPTCQNFGATNGRFTDAYRNQPGLAPDVTNGTQAAQLIANGCNFYGAYGTTSVVSNYYQPGSISGPFLWGDSYTDQQWLNSNIQAAVLTLLGQVGNIPYNAQGYTLIAEACSGPIAQALQFGAIRAGVVLSATQVAYVDNAAGFPIAGIIQARGWYLLIQQASAAVRAARGSPPISLYYTDGQSIQNISLFSEEVA